MENLVKALTTAVAVLEEARKVLDVAKAAYDAAQAAHDDANRNAVTAHNDFAAAAAAVIEGLPKGGKRTL